MRSPRDRLAQSHRPRDLGGTWEPRAYCVRPRLGTWTVPRTEGRVVLVDVIHPQNAPSAENIPQATGLGHGAWEGALELFQRFAQHVVCGGPVKQSPVEPEHIAVVGAAKQHGIMHNRVEYRLRVSRRLADHS